MANAAGKTEHSGAKKGKGAYYGRKKRAKLESNQRRREDSKIMLNEEESDQMTLDQFSYHEALDRAWIQLSSFEGALGEHPVILSEPEVQAAYDQCVEKLNDLYQLLGPLSVK